MPRKSQDGPISLRMRKLANGGKSLYLDVYVNNQRYYEFLHLHLVPERTKADKDLNRETLSLANAIKAKRFLELKNGEYGFKTRESETDFLTYYNNVANEREREATKATRFIWNRCASFLKEYDADKIKISSIDTKWINGFIDFLRQKNLKDTSVACYFTKIKCVLNHAHNNGVISRNFLTGIKPIKSQYAPRTYLTLEELRLLAATPYQENVKAPFLFSCLTGLRYSDVEALTWANVSISGGMTRITFQQKKTKRQEYLDISPQAVRYMGKPAAPRKHVFDDILTPALNNMHINAWAAKAGIHKHLSFHCARHTFATLMLTCDVDLYTVSKLLGHSAIKTTQIYAKIIDKKKQEAVNLIPSIEDTDK